MALGDEDQIPLCCFMPKVLLITRSYDSWTDWDRLSTISSMWLVTSRFVCCDLFLTPTLCSLAGSRQDFPNLRSIMSPPLTSGTLKTTHPPVLIASWNSVLKPDLNLSTSMFMSWSLSPGWKFGWCKPPLWYVGWYGSSLLLLVLFWTDNFHNMLKNV